MQFCLTQPGTSSVALVSRFPCKETIAFEVVEPRFAAAMCEFEIGSAPHKYDSFDKRKEPEWERDLSERGRTSCKGACEGDGSEMKRGGLCPKEAAPFL